MHRQAEAPGLADPRQQLRPAQAAPVVMVGEDHLDGVLPDGRGQVAREAPMPGVGSSRYSSTPASSRATPIDVSGVQAAFGSSRSGWSGKASRSALIASISCAGGKTPPLSLGAGNR